MTPRVPFAERGGAVRGLLDLTTLCYPAFLFGGSIRGVLPVFHFHEVTREWLEPRLQYLVDNGYRGVTCDEIARLVVEGIDPGPRAVGLTFDDAWASVWTVAMPLLRQLGLRAILFAIPARIDDATVLRPTIDADATKAPEAWETGTAVRSPFATWPELRAMHTSGVFDVQSHTRSHAKMFCDPTLAGFVTPSYGIEPFLDRPLASANGHVSFVEPDALGTPLYLRRSRMTDARRFLADERAAEGCREHVVQHGGAGFFDRPAWRAELETVAASAGGGSGFENEAAQSAAIRDELEEGRALLNDGLRTTSVRHVALPWGLAGAITRRALATTGHLTAFAERPLKRRGVRAGDDRYGLMRLSSRFLTCLPGRGRQWFFTTVR